MHKFIKTLNKFNGNLAFVGVTDTGDYVFECNRQDQTLSYALSSKPVQDLCLNDSESYLVAFGDTWLGKYETGVLTENYINLGNNADKIAKSSDGYIYAIDRSGNRLMKFGVISSESSSESSSSSESGGILIWEMDLPDYALRLEGCFVYRESDNSILYFNSLNIHVIRDDLTQGTLINSLAISGAGDIRLVISGEFNAGHSYIRYRQVDGEQLWSSSSSSSSSSSTEIRSSSSSYDDPPHGSGTIGDPYRIIKLPDLVWMKDNVASSTGKYYKLMNDIDATSTSGWNAGEGFIPIGNSAVQFNGNFDGNGKIITNLFINRPADLPASDYQGLFGYTETSSTITSLGLVGVSITGRNLTGGMVGDNHGSISNCYATGNITLTTSSGARAGGLVGANSAGLISGCYTTVQVICGSGTAGAVIGGVVGRLSGGSVKASYATGDVSSASTGTVGGFAGQIAAGSISDCYATGLVTGLSGVGGFAGAISNTGSTGDCYATGMVTGTSNVGGFVGIKAQTGSISDCYATGPVTVNGVGGTRPGGGLAGLRSGGVISNSYSAGLIIGVTGPLGGFLGRSTGGSDTSCFWDANTSGQVTTAGTATLKTTVQMMQQATFDPPWDFTTVWDIVENVTYPFFDSGTFAVSSSSSSSSTP